MIVVSYPPAPRRTGFIAPRAISRMGAAVMEARAAGGVPRPVPAAQPVPLRPIPATPRRRPEIRLWLPSSLIFLLLAPFALLLAPLLYLAPPPYRARPYATVIGLGQVLLALSGTVVDVDSPDALVRIRLV